MLEIEIFVIWEDDCLFFIIYQIISITVIHILLHEIMNFCMFLFQKIRKPVGSFVLPPTDTTAYFVI